MVEVKKKVAKFILILIGLLFIKNIFFGVPAAKEQVTEEEQRRRDKASDAEYEARHGKYAGSYKNKYTGEEFDVTKWPDGAITVKSRKTGNTVVASPDDIYISPGN